MRQRPLEVEGRNIALDTQRTEASVASHLVFPGEGVTFGEVGDVEFAQEVEELGAVVHGVGEEVGNGTAEGFLARGGVEGVEPEVVPGVAGRDGAGGGGEVGVGAVEAGDERGNRV